MNCTIKLDGYRQGFEEDHRLRSSFIRDLTLDQLRRSTSFTAESQPTSDAVPRTLVRYWNDLTSLPDDVRACLDSWDRLRDHGFSFHMFTDASAAAFIAHRFGPSECKAFERCRHPAMRSDYLRMCFILAEGGWYVDADDVLLGDGWEDLFRKGGLKVQPLCYDLSASAMVPSAEIWRTDLLTDERIFYVNNDPIAAPAGHPVLQRALTRATNRLLGDDPLPEIQSTTGPGNLTAALAGHARDCLAAGVPYNVELLRAWDEIAETRWDLSYRGDARNWRNMDVCVDDHSEGGAE